MATQNNADHMLGGGRHAADAILQVGDLVVDLRHERVTRNGREIPLPKLSFDLLAALVRAAPEFLSVDSLMQTVWPRLVVGPETVVQRVKLLRDILGDDSKRPRYVAGVRGRGYRLVAPVGVVGAESPASPAEREQGTRSGPFSSLKLAAIAASICVLLAGAVLLTLPSAQRAAAAPRVAVLPFENLSRDPDDAFLADGMHDELISALAERAPSIDVIARTTMLTFRDHSSNAAHAVAAELGAAYVISGTVRRDAAHVLFTVQLIDPRTDSALWSHAYDRTADAGSLRSEVAADIAARLPVRTAAETSPRSASARSPEAYELYLRGLVARVAASGGYSRSAGAIRAVEEPLTRAIELDPSFADAYAERAAIRLGKIVYNLDTSDAQLELASEDVAAAEWLAPSAPKTLAARALYLLVSDDFDGALAKFTAAEAAGLADPMWMLDATTILTDRRSPADALREVERVLAIDPRNPVAIGVYAGHLLAAHRPLDAVRALDLGIVASPQDPSLEGLRAFAIFGSTGVLAPMPEIRDPEGALAGSDAAPADVPLARAFDGARWGGRIDEFAKQLATMPPQDVRAGAPGAGLEPVARYRGWTSLLMGDAGAAAAEGRSIREFLAGNPETPRNRFFRRLLEAEAYTFEADAAHAVSVAKEVAAGPSGTDLFSQRDKEIAAIYAWNGDTGDALDLLERLAVRTPGVAPAEIVRDPLYTMPLAHDARFQALAARLEGQMRATTIR